jgi:hypothetical protein
MDYLLRGGHPVLATLREQLAVATVAAREFTGVGFFTRFHVPPTASRLPSPRPIVISDVHAEVSGLQHGAGFVLFVEDGVLDTRWSASSTKMHGRLMPSYFGFTTCSRGSEAAERWSRRRSAFSTGSRQGTAEPSLKLAPSPTKSCPERFCLRRHRLMRCTSPSLPIIG